MSNLFFRRFFLGLLVIFQTYQLRSQSSETFWTKMSEAQLKTELCKRKVHPESFDVYHLNISAFKATLLAAGSNTAKNASGIIMEFPLANGAFERFQVSESPVLEPKLAEKYPMIKTYKAIGLDDKTATMRFSVTPKGLHVYSVSGKRSAVFIDPYTVSGDQYMVYNRASLGIDTQDLECLTEEDIDLKSLRNNVEDETINTADRILRTYRLALTCNAKYGALFAGNGTDEQKRANILTQMALTINRVNEIYERDLAIHLVLINRNDELLYYDTDADPWGTEFSTKTQQVISNTLGDEDLYDIGHNFNTTNGGNSGCIGCVCVDAYAPYVNKTSKGRGYTGMPDPQGDAFDIDFVCHEMGHQFGAWHTMNTCSRSGNGTSEVEPASGSSIMGYAGVCGVNNVQEFTDAHFNYVSVKDIAKNIQPGGNSACGAQTALDNKPPVANAGNNYTIPVGTPFVLRGTATDPDGTETLTYNWSQNDPERAPNEGAPKSTWAVGPLYRSLLPTASPNRYFPKLETVASGSLRSKWEVTPTVARTMNFSFIVRDNGSGFAAGVGQTHSDLMQVAVVDGTPFKVSSQNNGKDWYVGNSYKVSWEVGQTNTLPVNCLKVNVKLSLDGGLTYPVVLASNVANDGEENIIVPDVETNMARIMVEAADNIFYALSDVNFSVIKSDPIFVFDRTDDKTSYEVCDNAKILEIPFTYTTVSNFSEETSFAVSGLPTGVTATFSPASMTTDGEVVLKLETFNLAGTGNHNFKITASSASLTKSNTETFKVISSELVEPELMSPVNQQKDSDLSVYLEWLATENAEGYILEVAKDVNFTSEANAVYLSETTYLLEDLAPLTTYFWRVKAKNDCGESLYSSVYSFSSSRCSRCKSFGDVEQTFLTSTTRVIFNTIDNKSGKTSYSDFTALSTTVNVGETYPLTVQVNTAGSYVTNTVVWIDWNYNCSFDDDGERYLLGEADAVDNGATSNSPIQITVPDDAVIGNKIIMRVSTKFKSLPSACETEFDGEVEEYVLKVEPSLNITTHEFENFKVWPNPNKGAFSVALRAQSNANVRIAIFDLSGRQVFDKSYLASRSFHQDLVLKGLSSGMYMLEVTNGTKKSMKKILIH